MNEILTVDVLVVGAGPAGLSTALSAARHGAAVLVVERHPGTAIHPRSLGLTTRTMEVFRGWGITRAVRAASLAVLPHQTHARSLADPVDVPSPTGYPMPRDALAVSPAAPAYCPQDLLEPILLDRARELGAAVRFRTELTHVRVGPDGVRATLSDGTAVDARYVVGADGPRSTVRTALGIPVERKGMLGDFEQVLFRADLARAVRGRTYAIYGIEHPDAGGVMLPVGLGRWAYAREWEPGMLPSDWRALIRTATGLADLEPEILGILPFTMAVDVATTYRAGPGFLVGDAAHRMTPLGGIGLNTAVHDGHNLGWKLAWATRGLAGEALLDSYDAERRPIGLRNALTTLESDVPEPPAGLAVDLGTVYRSAVIADGGNRVPHRWVEHAGHRVSTLDLVGAGFTLLTGGSGAPWRAAAAGSALHAPDVTEPLDDLLDVDPAGAVLVRPDGHVAWRSRTAAADPVGALARAMDKALGRPTDMGNAYRSLRVRPALGRTA